MSLTGSGPAMIQCFVPLSVRARFIVQIVTINSREEYRDEQWMDVKEYKRNKKEKQTEQNKK